MPKRLLLPIPAVLASGGFSALATAKRAASAPVAKPASATVYGAKTGKKYQDGSSQDLRQSKTAITLGAARKCYISDVRGVRSNMKFDDSSYHRR